MTRLNQPNAQPPSVLMQSALQSALDSLGLNIKDINGLIAVPSLAETHFMVD
jgi:cobalamin biosynthesis protein CbiG